MQKVEAVNDVLLDYILVEGRTVIDIGCGAGDLVRWLHNQKARAIGLEYGASPLSVARGYDPPSPPSYIQGGRPPLYGGPPLYTQGGGPPLYTQGGGPPLYTQGGGPPLYTQGGGEALPFAHNLADVVLFSLSLHHIPQMLEALAEAHRVVKPGGQLVVIEPLAEGPYFEVQQIVDDETEVLKQAYATLKSLKAASLRESAEEFFSVESYVADPQQMIAELLQVEPGRAEKLKRYEVELKRRFYQVGVLTEQGYCFEWAFRLNVFEM